MELSALLGLWMYICVQGNWVQAKAKEVVDTGLKFEVPLQEVEIMGLILVHEKTVAPRNPSITFVLTD